VGDIQYHLDENRLFAGYRSKMPDLFFPFLNFIFQIINRMAVGILNGFCIFLGNTSSVPRG
jgi:hypothetical protein